MHHRVDPLTMARAFDRTPDLVSISEMDGRILHINPAGLELLGVDRVEAVLTLRTWNVFSDVGLLIAPLVERALTTVGSWQGVGELRRLDDGVVVPVSISAYVVERGGDDPPIIASIMRDRRRRASQDQTLQAATESAAYLVREQQAVGELGRLAVDASLQTLLDSATSAAAALMGVDCASISRVGEHSDDLEVVAYSGTGTPPAFFPSARGSAPGLALASDDVLVCSTIENEDRFDTSGMRARGLASVVCVPFASSPRPGVLSVHSTRPREYSDRDLAFLDTVTGILTAAIRRIELERQLRHRSLHDPLTGLPNRILAYRRIEEGLTATRRSATTVAVLLADLDDFKTVNDSLGHASGDAVLVSLARKLEAAARPGDTVARLGGDEFLIVCDGITDVEAARERAHELSTVLSDVDTSGADPIPFTASIGIALADDTVRGAEELVRRADLAMYRAKGSAPGSIDVFDRLGSYDADRVLRLSTDLRAAIEDGSVFLEYQPIHDLWNDTIVGVEALARWTHPTFGPVSPTEFVAVAERTGLIGRLGEWAVATACEAAVTWPGTTTVHVNVSGHQLHDPRFCGMVRFHLDRTGLDVSRLGLEVTETVWVAETTRVVTTLTELHEMGVTLALDDMGTGYSSISYLDRYPMFACFKIDGSYIAKLPGSRPEAIVKAIMTLADAFEVDVVGEGVETADQAESYRVCGGRYAQGFHLSRPMDAASVAELLQSYRSGRADSLRTNDATPGR